MGCEEVGRVSYLSLQIPDQQTLEDLTGFV